MILEGDLLVGHLTISGTQLGPYMGAPARGKTFRIEAVDILRLRDGKAVEHWGVMAPAAVGSARCRAVNEPGIYAPPFPAP